MDKKELRGRMKAVGAVDPDVGAKVVDGLRSWLGARLPGTISAYLAMAIEVDVATLFDQLPGWNWVLPRVEDDKSLTFRDRDVPREVHPFGMTQPAELGVITPFNQIDVFLVPGLAFDRAGRRLGKGGGFYDGVLSNKRADAVAIGVTTESRLVDEVPVEDHDVPVGWLATELGVMECAPRR